MQLAGTDIRLLRVFAAVVRHRGFAAAQAELNVSQPTISGQIAALEERLNVVLCQRGRAGFRLTPQGEVVHRAVERLLRAMDGFVADTSALRGTLGGQIHIGVVDSVASDQKFLLPQAIAGLNRAAPEVRFHLVQGSPQDLQSSVLDERLDMAIGSFPHKISGLDYLPLYDERNLLYCGKDHILWQAEEAKIRLEQIKALPTAGRSYWRDDHLNNRDFQNTVAQANGVEQQLILILSGRFVGYLPEHVAAHLVEAGRLRCLLPKLCQYTCSFEAVTKRNAPTSPAVAALQDALRHQYANP